MQLSKIKYNGDAIQHPLESFLLGDIVTIEDKHIGRIVNKEFFHDIYHYQVWSNRLKKWVYDEKHHVASSYKITLVQSIHEAKLRILS